jgi:hypothetical protein
MASNPSSVFPSLHRRPRLSDTAVKESREAAIREAKQHVRDIVRNDWSFDPPSSLFTTSVSLSPVTSLESTVATTTTSLSSAPSTLDRQSEVLEWRLRELATSSESETEGGDSAGKGTGSDPYRFESPDTVAASIAERRRKWRAEVEDEIRWNPGLRFWMERRHAWTGAKKRRLLRDSLQGLPEQGRRASGGGDGRATAQSHDPVLGTSPPDEGQHGSLSNGEGNRSSLAAETEPETMEHRREETTLGSSSTNERLEALSLSKDSGHDGQEGAGKRLFPEDDDSDDYDSNESLIPVVEPLLPSSNPVRSSITPAIYSSIYSKVVVQGLTPTVPINLADVTKAMVEGWKSDGQWPPKPTMPVPGSDVPARRKGKAAAAHNNTLINSQSYADETGNRTRKDSHSHSHSHHGSGVTHAVKKVLGLSHHTFHLRRSSRGGGGGSQGESEAGGRAGISGETPITEVPVVEDDLRAFR